MLSRRTFAGLLSAILPSSLFAFAEAKAQQHETTGILLLYHLGTSPTPVRINMTNVQVSSRSISGFVSSNIASEIQILKPEDTEFGGGWIPAWSYGPTQI